MTNKDAMICDIETGICGPASEVNSGIELIDLSSLSPKNDFDSANKQADKDK